MLKEPKSLFIVDGFGALLSVFLLGFVLVAFENTFGIPKNTLHLLAIVPCFFAVYDFFCFFLVKKIRGVHLRAIATMNLLYCILSIAFAFYHRHEITFFGWNYIALEVVIVLFLSRIEWKTSIKLESQ